MKHTTAIRKDLESGKTDAAFAALDNLLLLGPNNIEALKLKAKLLAAKGQFQEEAKIFEKILGLDNEDIDAVQFFLRRHTEDREHYYFSDALTDGGRRYYAYPQALITTSLIGLFGCISFLLMTRFGESYPILLKPEIMLANFAVFVMLPWMAILATYFRSIKSVTISNLGIEIATRLRVFKFLYGELQQIALVHDFKDSDRPELGILLVPKDTVLPSIHLSLSEHDSCIRARSHFIKELANYTKSLAHRTFDEIDLQGRKLLRY